MLLSSAISEIQTILGFRTDLNARIVQQLGRAQEHFQEGPVYPWFLLSEESTTTTSEDSYRVKLPDDFLAEDEECALWYVPTDTELDEIELTKSDFDELKRAYGTTAEGPPEAYSQEGLYFRIFPRPDAEYTLKMLYYKKDTAIANIGTDETCLWLTHAPRCLIGYAGKILAGVIGNANAVQIFSVMETQAMTKLNTENVARRERNRSWQMGGEH